LWARPQSTQFHRRTALNRSSLTAQRFIDNAGGHSNSAVWQQIQSIEGGWVDKNNSEAGALEFSVKNSKDFRVT
jgi:hypothetical protein